MTLGVVLRFTKSLIPFRIRKIDKEFTNFLVLLKGNENKSYDEMRKYQFKRLKVQVENAYNYTEFYKRKYDDFGFNPEDLKDLKDVKKIPLLTREEVRINSKSMLLNNFKGKAYYGYTSGTTGHPVKLFYDKKTRSREWASICYQWERVGYKPTEGRVEFRGFIEKNVDYIFFPDEKVLRINIIRMSEKNIESIIKKIKSKDYQYFHGYPSAIYKLAKILEEKKIEIRPKAILLASEVLYDWQMELIDKIFPHSKIIIHYGQAERVALGAWNKNREYYFIPSYGLLEINEENNEMIATSFINDIMPIIRYKLTDSIEGYREKPNPSEPMLYPIIKTIHGRIEDYTYNLKGEMIPPAVVTFPFKNLKYVKASKIIQHSLSDFSLLIEAEKSDDSLKETKGLVNDLKKIYGVNINMNVEFIEKIPVDKSGKFRWIESNLKNLN